MRLPQPEQQRLPVIIALENRFSPVTPCHQMINRPRILMSQGSWYTQNVAQTAKLQEGNVIDLFQALFAGSASQAHAQMFPDTS
jgi:hypothetical protein